MKLFLWHHLVACFAICFGHSIARAADRPPNVIVILTDDQGSVDVNCYGAKDLVTPHMDALAARGVRFTQFYAAAPVCSPSRAALMTGRNPHRAGVPNNAGTKKGDQNGMPAAQVTMAEMFQAAGYATAHIGKWHLGYVPPLMPNAQGFDYSFGHLGGCIDNYSHFYYWGGPNQHDLYRNGEEVFETGTFFGDLMVREASQFMRQHQDEPFFMYYAINMPHYPYQGDDKWLEHYRDLPYPRNLYAAFVSTIDDRLGQLIGEVEQLGLSDNTIIVFQSDHGHSTEVRAHLGGGSSGPYRGAKFSLLEGGIRVPAMIVWPGEIPAGEVRGQLATACDWLPTLADLCGVAMPDHRLDGKNLNDVIHAADAPSPHESFYWQYQKQFALRWKNWKLYGNDGKVALYDLVTDPGEMRDMSSEQMDIVRQLQEMRHEAAAELTTK